jgi:hypothetical protein
MSANNKGFQNNSSADLPAKSRLPFEPASNRKKAAKPEPVQSNPKKAAKEKGVKSIAKPDSTQSSTARSFTQSTPKATAKGRRSAGIPEVVSTRMARRMGLFCGIPTSLGMLTFVICYLLVSQYGVKVPPVVVLLVSLGFFGLGVLGLTYGVLSASWDEDRVGTRLGWQDFATNFRRLTESWRSAKQEPKS